MRLAVKHCNAQQHCDIQQCSFPPTRLSTKSVLIFPTSIDHFHKRRRLRLGSVHLFGMRLWGSMEWDSESYTATHCNTHMRFRGTKTRGRSNSMGLFCKRLLYHTLNCARLALLHNRQCWLLGSVSFEMRLWRSTLWDSQSNTATNKAQQHKLCSCGIVPQETVLIIRERTVWNETLRFYLRRQSKKDRAPRDLASSDLRHPSWISWIQLYQLDIHWLPEKVTNTHLIDIFLCVIAECVCV